MMPLYEAKMLHHFDHRWATYDGVAIRDVKRSEKQSAEFSAKPRYWVPQPAVLRRLEDKWAKGWLMGWRDIARSTDERTLISAVLPPVGVGHKFPLIRQRNGSPAVLLALLSSFAADYLARTKVASTSMTYFYVKQFPLPAPATTRLMVGEDWFEPRVLELTYTAWDMAGFAIDMGDCSVSGQTRPPFVWDEDRRSWLRAELDAMCFHLYGISRQDVDYIMDTYPIVRRREETQYGEYRTKIRILRCYDAIESTGAGKQFTSLLEPSPGKGSRHNLSDMERES